VRAKWQRKARCRNATLREEGSLAKSATVSLGWFDLAIVENETPKSQHHAAKTAAECWMKWNDPSARFETRAPIAEVPLAEFFTNARKLRERVIFG
jgi:hypothetical protein